ncbi:bifunctional methylenetetrahydrofolate dehydrogenase/methenyltetrahydrofolate cyclohydrolase FolD [Haliovirga abyssi]|uniref:Bifunctional protein FolD n=1 Tax=Haliovirga abyssi TaxID=2996794 RepID=A0AAU9D2R0_9FUSO|nr:bifunctional methylenetetrahydrofolate dehydrogenase/methenyltetrahydrofolate cyclohydrolase FolD [Haliovirga abyssi]BDU50284.1 bifunctional protein FolD [Haliovirga abyssi]
MYQLIDGKKISSEIKDEIKTEVSELKEKMGAVPGLAVILVGDNSASQVYVNSKERACKALGFHSEKYELSADTTEEELLKLIDELNEKSEINGILVQLPVPKQIDTKKVLNRISAEKDVDGFHPLNVGKLAVGDESAFYSCTPYGIIEMLKRSNIEIEGKEAVIVGRSNIVGKPMALLLLQENATVTVAHSRTKDLASVVKRADIIIAAVGRAKLITEDMVKDGAVIIDVGMNRVDGKLCGDVDFENVKDKCSYITPVPGGVGPMTIAMLMKNTLISFKRSKKI